MMSRLLSRAPRSSAALLWAFFALLTLSAAARPVAAQPVTIPFEGTFGTVSAGFPYPTVARFSGSFTYDPSAPPVSSANGASEFALLSTTFTYYDATGEALFTTTYTSHPDTAMRVGDGFLYLFLGPGVTGPNDPGDFRLYMSGSQFSNTGSAPSPAAVAAATFWFGFAEAGGYPAYTEASVASVDLIFDTQAPSVTALVNPQQILPPNGKMVPVTVSGQVTDEAGGSGVDVGSGKGSFTVLDSQGATQTGTFDIASDGTYTFNVALEAKHNGKDKRGRIYTIVVEARDVEGNVGDTSVQVVVPHNQGK